MMAQEPVTKGWLERRLQRLEDALDLGSGLGNGGGTGSNTGGGGGGSGRGGGGGRDGVASPLSSLMHERGVSLERAGGATGVPTGASTGAPTGASTSVSTGGGGGEQPALESGTSSAQLLAHLREWRDDGTITAEEYKVPLACSAAGAGVPISNCVWRVVLRVAWRVTRPDSLPTHTNRAGCVQQQGFHPPLRRPAPPAAGNGNGNGNSSCEPPSGGGNIGRIWSKLAVAEQRSGPQVSRRRLRKDRGRWLPYSRLIPASVGMTRCKRRGSGVNGRVPISTIQIYISHIPHQSSRLNSGAQPGRASPQTWPRAPVSYLYLSSSSCRKLFIILRGRS
jgi:hypothetical protein